MKAKFMYVLLATLLMGSQLTLSAQNQPKGDKKERPTQEQILQMQTDQMVKTLMLDDATAAKFTPIYAKYLKELRECRMMNRADRQRSPQGVEAKETAKPSLTDAEVEKMIKDQFAQSRKMLDVREKYYGEFRKILSPKQIMRIYQMEKSNANKFKKEFNKRKGQRPGQGRHQGERNHAPRGPQGK